MRLTFRMYGLKSDAQITIEVQPDTDAQTLITEVLHEINHLAERMISEVDQKRKTATDYYGDEKAVGDSVAGVVFKIRG